MRICQDETLIEARRLEQKAENDDFWNRKVPNIKADLQTVLERDRRDAQGLKFLKNHPKKRRTGG